MHLFQINNKKNITRDWGERIRFYIAGWLLASILFFIIRRVGNSGDSEMNVTVIQSLWLLPFISIISGTVFGSLLYFFDKYLFRKIPLWKLLLRLALAQIIIISLVIGLFFPLVSVMKPHTLNLWEFLKSPVAFIYYLYVFIVNSSLSFLWEITRLLGRGNFLKLVTGKFYFPKEEYRIFMFVDLKSSTTIAEKLGHLEYSSFIKDCFYDLSVAHQYGTQIYQYVGDEAVLTWLPEKMKRITECIDAFWEFNDTLLRKATYYKDKYDMVPEFKAGMSVGMATVVEIGDYKKEIAYHGNVLNTAARIEEMCNVLNEKILISKKLYDVIAGEKSCYTYTKVAETQLRGKQGITEIYSVHKNAGN
jgi:adenylate cyclase